MLNKAKLAQKIKGLREKFGLSQEDFAKKIGLSRVALSQFEVGKRNLEALELAKIAEALEVSVDFLFHDGGIAAPIIEKRAKMKIFTPDKEKIKNTILYILEKCGGKPNIGETVLYKLLYFLDFDNYELYGASITGMNYKRFKFGPVPCGNDYCCMVEEMIKNNQLKVISQDYYGKIQKRYIALKNCNIDIFKPSELKTIDSVIARLSDMNAVQIEDYAHNDIPWRESQDGEIIDYDLVFCRNSQYSRRDYDWEMQSSVAEDYLKNESISSREFDYYEHL